MPRSDVQDQLDALRAEVAELRSNAAAGGSPTPGRGRGGSRPRRRILQALAAAAIAALLPAAVFASHAFTDVPDTNTFHTNISNLKQAGITTGCSPTTYCPDANVTRGQMAAFLNRGLGRVGNFDGAEVRISSGKATVVSGTMKTVGAGSILASVSSMAYTADASGCPCPVDLEIERDGDWSYYLRETMASTQRSISMTNQWVFEVDAAGTYTFNVWMNRVSGTATLDADAVLTLLYVPFDETGAASDGGLSSASQQRQGPRD